MADVVLNLKHWVPHLYLILAALFICYSGGPQPWCLKYLMSQIVLFLSNLDEQWSRSLHLDLFPQGAG